MVFVHIIRGNQTKITDEFFSWISLILEKSFITHRNAVVVKPVVTDLAHYHFVLTFKNSLALTIESSSLRARNSILFRSLGLFGWFF